MSNVKFSQLPNLGNITANTIVPVVAANTNYTVTAANLQSYVNSSTGNITGGNINSPTLNNGANINVVANAQSWTFGTDGILTLPDGSQIQNGFISGAPGSAGGVTNGGTGYQQFYAQGDGAYVQTSVGNAGTVFNTWQFGLDGNLTLPQGGIVYETAIPFGSLTGNTIALKPQGGTSADQQLLIYPTVTPGTDANHLHLTSGNLYNTELFLGNDNLYVKLANTGNVVVNTDNGVGGTGQWTFDVTGNLTLPGNTFAVKYANGAAVSLGGNYGNANVVANLAALGSNPVSTTGNITSGNLKTGGLISATGNITGNYVLGNGSQLTGLPATYGNSNVVSLLSAFGSNTVSTTGNVTAGNIINTGISSVTGNITAGNVLTAGVISATGNVTTANYFVGNLVGTTASMTGNVSATGNVTAANFFGNGNTLSNVATTFQSTWTVPTGNSTQSFTVAASKTYLMWVDCNIPNGILTWNATATVTNTNVPVVGVQYAWVYNGGGTPIDFTSIPNQFVGTANSIVRSSTAPSATTNRFDFGINNTSGGNVTVRYGWITIS
jgi:hypothetical protein